MSLHQCALRAGRGEATRATSWLAGRMRVGRGAVRETAKNGARMWPKGQRAYRASAKKGRYGRSSNLTYGTKDHSAKGRSSYFNFHINHMRFRQWGRYR